MVSSQYIVVENGTREGELPLKFTTYSNGGVYQLSEVKSSFVVEKPLGWGVPPSLDLVATPVSNPSRTFWRSFSRANDKTHRRQWRLFRVHDGWLRNWWGIAGYDRSEQGWAGWLARFRQQSTDPMGGGDAYGLQSNFHCCARNVCCISWRKIWLWILIGVLDPDDIPYKWFGVGDCVPQMVYFPNLRFRWWSFGDPVLTWNPCYACSKIDETVTVDDDGQGYSMTVVYGWW